jgi:hypothetical protein
MNCDRCGFTLKDYKIDCNNCGEHNPSPYRYYRVDAQNQIKYWIEQMRTCNCQEAFDFVANYKNTYPGCPVRLRVVTEEEV